MLKIRDISYSVKQFALQGISLHIQKGDYYMILGKSGSGKSMLLEIIAGLKKPDAGQIIYEGKDITQSSTSERRFVMVYQNLALFPHMKVFENIAFPLRCRKVKSAIISAEVAVAAESLGISHLLERTPAHLSGGEAQRVALARALILKPAILLLDEPLASLDVEIKSDIRRLLRRINKEGQTIVHVTHDFSETLALAHKVAVIENGRLIQSGTAEEVFENPQNTFVANLTGHKNFFAATLHSQAMNNGLRKVVTAQEKLTFPIKTTVPSGNGYLIFDKVELLSSDFTPYENEEIPLSGVVSAIEKTHHAYELIVDAGIPVSVLLSHMQYKNNPLKEGQQTYILIRQKDVRFIRTEA